jgi:hypothetical protein
LPRPRLAGARGLFSSCAADGKRNRSKTNLLWTFPPFDVWLTSRKSGPQSTDGGTEFFSFSPFSRKNEKDPDKEKKEEEKKKKKKAQPW